MNKLKYRNTMHLKQTHSPPRTKDKLSSLCRHKGLWYLKKKSGFKPHKPNSVTLAWSDHHKSPQNINQLRIALFHHLKKTSRLWSLLNFPLVSSYPGPFIWAAAQRGTPSGNRCCDCLMLACIGAVGLEARSNCDLILEGPQPHISLPPWSLMKQPGAKNTHSCAKGNIWNADSLTDGRTEGAAPETEMSGSRCAPILSSLHKLMTKFRGFWLQLYYICSLGSELSSWMWCWICWNTPLPTLITKTKTKMIKRRTNHRYPAYWAN